MSINRFQKYKDYYQKLSNNSDTAVFVIDIPLNGNSIRKNYCIESIIHYCDRYKLDLIVQKDFNPNYIIYDYVNWLNLYYAKFTFQLFSMLVLFQDYENVIILLQNDIFITPQCPDILKFHKEQGNAFTLFYQYDFLSKEQKDQFKHYHINKKHITNFPQRKIYDKLLKKVIGYQLNNSDISWFMNCFSRKISQFINFQLAQQFISKVMAIDYQNKFNLWDTFFYILFPLIMDNTQWSIMNKIDYTQMFKYQQVVNNTLYYNQNNLLQIYNNNPYIIHFQGGGTNSNNIRFGRSKWFYEKYYGGK